MDEIFKLISNIKYSAHPEIAREYVRGFAMACFDAGREAAPWDSERQVLEYKYKNIDAFLKEYDTDRFAE